MTSSFRAVSVEFLTVETTLPMMRASCIGQLHRFDRGLQNADCDVDHNDPVANANSFSTIDHQNSIMLKAVLFDFNGVIVDDEPLHLELFRRVLGEEGIALTEEEYRSKYLGYDNRKCFVAALTDAGRTEQARDDGLIAALMARKMDYYLGAINERFLLFPGVVELARSLATRYPMAIVS